MCKVFPNTLQGRFDEFKALCYDAAKRQTYKDARHGGWPINGEKRQRLDSELRSELADMLRDSNIHGYHNTFSKKVVPYPATELHHPLSPSLGCSMPIAWGMYGVYRAGKDNMRIIPACIACAQKNFLPACLGLVSKYTRRVLDLEQKGDNGDTGVVRDRLNEHVELIRRMHSAKNVGDKIPYSLAERLRFRLSQEEAKYLHDQMVAGRPHEKIEIPLLELADGWSSKKGVFLETRLKFVMDILAEMRVFFGFALPTVPNADGCPWFLDGEIPPGWCWGACHSLVIGRLTRMIVYCNRHAKDTHDNEVTIFLEAVFQAYCRRLFWQPRVPTNKQQAEICMLRRKYKEFLSLPLVWEERNPLCFSVGHRKHGQDMLTGWPREPRRLRDRVDDHNNILFEAQLSNMLKQDYRKEDYPGIIRQIYEINMPPHIYDPRPQLGPRNQRLEAGIHNARLRAMVQAHRAK